MDSRYTDPALVDPELPSSWKARQIATQLSNDEMSFAATAAAAAGVGNVQPHKTQMCSSSGSQDRCRFQSSLSD